MERLVPGLDGRPLVVRPSAPSLVPDNRGTDLMMRGEGRTVVRIRKMQLKIVLVGERRVGKTSLLERYLKSHFTEDYTGTLGGRVYPTDLEVAPDGGGIAPAHLALFDMMGRHPVREVLPVP